jgi:hypothetical protein
MYHAVTQPWGTEAGAMAAEYKAWQLLNPPIVIPCFCPSANIE